MAKTKAKNKKVVNLVLKCIFLPLLFIFAYGVSYHVNGFYETNKKLVILILCGMGGFAAFYLIYYLAVFIQTLINNSKEKKKSKEQEVELNLINDNYKIVYDKKNTALNNLKNILTIYYVFFIRVSKQKGGKSKYFYSNFTIYNAIDVFLEILNKLQSKIDELLKAFEFLGLQNIHFDIEKSIKKLVVKEDAPKKKENIFSKITTKIKNFSINKTASFAYKLIEDLANSILNEVMLETCKIFDIKDIPKYLEENKFLEQIELEQIPSFINNIGGDQND